MAQCRLFTGAHCSVQNEPNQHMVCLARSSPVSTIKAQAEAIIANKPSNKIGAEQGARDITKVEVIFCVY